MWGIGEFSIKRNCGTIFNDNQVSRLRDGLKDIDIIAVDINTPNLNLIKWDRIALENLTDMA